MGASALQVAHGIAGRLALVSGPDGAPLADVTAAAGRALISLKGAQVLSFAPAGADDLLWLSPAARLGGPDPIRGGVPVCWPWFAAHPSDPAGPMHGFARTADWQVIDASVTAQTNDVRIVFGFASKPGHSDLWPFAARLKLTVTVGSALSLELETHNSGSQAFALTQALHAYFRVGDVAQASVEGLDGADYLDKVDRFSRKRQTGLVIIDREVDRIYVGTCGTTVIDDRCSSRRIAISKQGSSSTVVWNPWGPRAARMGDLGPDGWRHFLCVETTNAGDDVIGLEPGARHTLAATYSLRQPGGAT